jgi:hypothetical protein
MLATIYNFGDRRQRNKKFTMISNTQASRPGSAIALRKLDSACEQQTVAIAWLDGDTVCCDDEKLLGSWTHDGIVGRSSQGRLFPHDGQAFLDELPFMYKSPYFLAAPISHLPQAGEGTTPGSAAIL